MKPSHRFCQPLVIRFAGSPAPLGARRRLRDHLHYRGPASAQGFVQGGPDLPRLQAISGHGVEFLGAVSDDVLRELYRRAQAVILPGEEDFGIVPVEAMACGRPAIALGRGGACETVQHEVTGLLVPADTPDAFAEAIHRVPTCRFDGATLRSHAMTFGVQRFETALGALIDDALDARAC